MAPEDLVPVVLPAENGRRSSDASGVELRRASVGVGLLGRGRPGPGSPAWQRLTSNYLASHL
jgi:hypothetical protein